MRPIVRALNRWLEDVEAGNFKAPHINKNGQITVRISAIWWHCMDHEYFADEKIAPRGKHFNDSLADTGAVIKNRSSRMIDGAIYSGMAVIDKFLLKRRYKILYQNSLAAHQTASSPT